MDILSLPLHIVVALWVLKRIERKPKKTFILVNPVDRLSAQCQAMNGAISYLPDSKYKWLSTMLYKVILRHYIKLMDEAEMLDRLNVAAVGFIEMHK